MGTNYYHLTAPVPTCTVCGAECGECRELQRVHIGKASFGWTFSFHATDTIRSWQDWRTALAAGGTIVNEYGDVETLESFEDLVTRKMGEPNHHARQYPDGSFTDPEGHSFSTGWFS